MTGACMLYNAEQVKIIQSASGRTKTWAAKYLSGTV